MSLIIKKQKNAKLEPGRYVALLKEIKRVENVETPWGNRDVLDFFFEIEGLRIKERCLEYYAEDSKLGSFIKGMNGESPERVNLEDFVGKKYNVIIDNNKSNGKIWVNIDEIKGEHPDSEDSNFEFEDF